jgi:hypothetical protein
MGLKFSMDFRMSFDVDEKHVGNMMKELGVSNPEDIPDAAAAAMSGQMSEDLGGGCMCTLLGVDFSDFAKKED